MQPQRILILTNRIPWPLHDGGALAMDAMIRGYHRAGCMVYLLAMHTTRHPVPEEKLRMLYPELHRFEWVAVDNRVRRRKVAANFFFSRLPEHAGRFRSRRFAERLKAVLAAFRPDVVQAESPFLSGYLPLIRSACPAITVLRMHNVEYQIWQRLAAEQTGVKKGYLQQLARRMMRYEENIWNEYDLLLPITEADAQIARESGCNRPMVVAPFGIDTRPMPAVQPEAVQAGYHIGAMDWLPNVAAIRWLLTDIWPAIRQAAPGFAFHFAGRHMPAELQVSLPEGVFCHGEVPDAAAFTAGKQVLLVPLRSGGGIRVKILEAMAAGKLVISTDTGMQGIEAVPGNHYLRANTPEAFADALAWCGQHTQEVFRMRQAAAALMARKYDAAVIMQDVLSGLRSLPRIRRG